MYKRGHIFLILLAYNQTVSPMDQCAIKPGAALNACQLFSSQKNPDGTNKLVTAATKYNTPLGVRLGANRLKTGFSRTLTHKNHPSGQELSLGPLSQQLDSFLDSVEVLIQADKTDYTKRFQSGKDDYFIVYFQRIQLTVLHELYQYLLSIYTTLNLTTITNTWDLVHNQMTYALNKKTLIINHLITIIEAQANKAITMRFPSIPQHLATQIGPVMMQHDYGADLNQMIEKDEITFFEELGYDTSLGLNALNLDKETKATYDYYKQRKTCYLEILGKYLTFFKNYTETLKQEDPIYGTQFVKYAQKIKAILDPETPGATRSDLPTKDKITYLRTIKTINPPLFFYNEDTIRALKIIPKIAKELPSNSQKIPWPQKLIQDAKTAAPITDKNGVPISNQPAAYFLDVNEQPTRTLSNATKLFVNIPTAKNMYSQQVKSQPDWLNSTDGIILMLRACLGDYTAVFQPELKNEKILDPCISCIIMNAANTAGLMQIDQTVCTDCNDYLKFLKDLIKKEEPVTPPPPEIPPL